MSIVNAQAIALRLPFEMGGPKPLFAGLPRQMEMLLIRIESHDGLVGWGEAFGLGIWSGHLARHTSLPVYASLMRYGSPERVSRNTHEALARGYRAIKLHEITAEPVRAARAAISAAGVAADAALALLWPRAAGHVRPKEPD